MQAEGYVFVELYVEDIAYYLHIFRDVLGFRLMRDEGDWMELRSSHGTILLNRFDEPEPGHPFEHYRDVPRRGVGVEIGIVVDAVEESWEEARKIPGCTVSEVHQQDWGLTDYRILTPQGYYLRVTSPRSYRSDHS